MAIRPAPPSSPSILMLEILDDDGGIVDDVNGGVLFEHIPSNEGRRVGSREDDDSS